jgi:hypothetical protein
MGVVMVIGIAIPFWILLFVRMFTGSPCHGMAMAMAMAMDVVNA